MKIGVHYSAGYERHDTGPGHPESIYRYSVLREALEKLPPEIVRLPGRRATVQDIVLAHEPSYHDIARQDVENLSDCLRTGDTMICEASYEVAMEATGAVLAAADAIMAGEVGRAFCAVRPPGHHATSSRGMGFCIFNHVAIAARHLQVRHGLKRIAIFDWDVHHGNGTEEIFYRDPDVLYISTHERGIYPFTGAAEDRGAGEGLGATLNLPMAHGSDGSVVLQAWDEQIGPALEAFRPEFLVISAGFDSRRDDPLGGFRWDDETFAELTRRCVTVADRYAGGRLLSSLEGGYQPSGLASAAVAHVRALAEGE